MSRQMFTELTFEQVITAVRSKLKDDEARISEAPGQFREAWWPGTTGFEQELMSDHGVPAPFPEIERAFHDEIAAIRDSLKHAGHKPTLAESQKGPTDVGRSLMTSLNLQADALSIWEMIAIPVRRRGEQVFRILAPRDVMGSPIVQALHVDHYIRGVSIKTAEDAAYIGGLTKKVSRWRLTSFVLGVIAALIFTWRFVA